MTLTCTECRRDPEGSRFCFAGTRALACPPVCVLDTVPALRAATPRLRARVLFRKAVLVGSETSSAVFQLRDESQPCLRPWTRMEHRETGWLSPRVGVLMRHHGYKVFGQWLTISDHCRSCSRYRYL